MEAALCQDITSYFSMYPLAKILISPTVVVCVLQDDAVETLRFLFFLLKFNI